MDLNQRNINLINAAAVTNWTVGSGSYNSFHDRLTMKNTNCQTGQAVYSWLGAMPVMQAFTGELQKQLIESADWTVKNVEYQMAWPIKRIEIERDQYGIYAPMIQEAGFNGKVHPDQLLAERLKAGFVEKGYTGQAFFSANQKHVKGVDKDKFTNNMTKKLTGEYFSTARAMLKKIKAPGGRPFNVGSKLVLMVSPDNEAMGEAILEAQFAAGGATNTSYNKAELVVNEFLDGPEWFLANVNGMARPMIFQEEKPTKFTYWTADSDYSVMQRKEFLYEAYGVYTVNYGLPQRIIGSTGADA